eukprot:TRINITY_DN74434_c0_g1_i1.p2 TRINITY_DN74434_c0_g1~~TRINITY_DN74434_c0_g1_i1.p2  ORF type:complete len:215 (-),score=40.86 TRINITY_DN74434_c0_g1_i1:317-961(-)
MPRCFFVPCTIASICGSERREEEPAPKVHYYAPASGPRMHSGLHVDTNGNSLRYVTAILYLSTLEPDIEDGATVFPVAGEKESAALRDAAETLISNGVLHTDLARSELEGPARALLSAAEARRGLSVVPEAGKLIVFFTCDDSGCEDPCSWHGGAVVKGDASASTASGKWILQVFKDLPRGARSGTAGAPAPGAPLVAAARRRCVALASGGTRS